MFKTILKNSEAEIIEKKSRFIANIFQVKSKEEAENKIKEIKKKYHDAKHNCFAYITFDIDGKRIEKCSDDGEPSGTAGIPLLTILKGENICNVLVVVTRYFGGILLGTGGLVRAYSAALTKALEQIEYILMEKGKEIKLTVSYSDVENVKYYCRKNSINIIKEEYLDNVEFVIEISNEMLDKLYNDFDNFSIKMTKIDILGEKIIKSTTTA